MKLINAFVAGVGFCIMSRGVINGYSGDIIFGAATMAINIAMCAL